MMPTTREFLGDSLIKELEGAGFSPQSINVFAKNEYRQRKAAQEEEQKRLLYRADDMKLDGKIREALLSGDINEQEARNAQKFEEFGAKKHGFALGAAKTVTGIANTVERVGDFINPFYEGKRDKDGNYIYQNGLEKSLRPKIKNVEKMRDDYEKATGETSWGSRLAEIGTELVGDPINFVGGVGLLSKGSKLAQFGKKTLYFAGTGAASGGVAALGEGKNDEETLKNIGAGAVGGALLGHAIDQGIQGISKLIAKRQASRMANETDAIDSAENSEFLNGGNSASKDVSSGNGSLEFPNTQSIAVTIVRGALKNEPLSTREQVLKEILSGEEKSSVIKPEKYKSILTGINEYKSYQNRLKHFHDNPNEVKNADLVFDQMQDDFMKANGGNTKKYYDAAPLFGRELKTAQTMTAKEFATKEVGLDEDTATNVLKEAMQGKEKSEFIDADSYNDIVKFKNFEMQREYAKAYGEKIQTAQASINNAREQSAIRYADTQKAINEYAKQGMSASATRELINAKFKPSADEINYTRAYNDRSDVDARLTGQGIFYALEKDIAAQAYTPEIYATRLKQRGFSDESVQAFTQAYANKDIDIAKEYVNKKVADAYESRVQREVADEIRAKNEVEDVGLAVRDGEAIDKPEIYEGNSIMDFSSKIDDNFLRENATELEPSGNLFDFLAKTKNNPSRDKILNHFADKAGEGDSRLLEHRMAYLNYIMPTIKEPLIKIFRSDGRISNIKPFIFTDANSKTKNVNFLSIVTDKEGNIDFITAYALKDKSQLRSEIKKGIKVEVRRGLARTFDPHSRIQVPNATKNIIPQKGNLINEEAKNSALPNGVSGIGDNASGAGGRQGGDEEILRQSGRNTSSASQTKQTAKSDEQMEQRSAFKTDGDTDATASSKQMVEEQGSSASIGSELRVNSNAHLGSGLVAGTLNSIDEDGNFNPDRFTAGFLAGLAGSKAVAIAARKMTPQLYNKILGTAKKMPQMAKDNPKLLGKLYANGKDVSLNSFAGEKAITANVGKLDQAKAMLEKGADEVEIWQKTGWFKDKDGAWKFEIGDSKARLNPNFKSGGRLGELLEHEELFKAYPELKDVGVVKIEDEIPSGAAQSIKNVAQREKRGIYNVAFNNKKSTIIRKDLETIDEIIKFEKGEADYIANGEHKSGYGALHIKKHLEAQNNGWVSKQEYLNMGQMLRKSTMQEADNKRIYTYFNDDGVRFRVVVAIGKNKERVISFYSNRKPLKAGLSYNSQNYDGNLPLNDDIIAQNGTKGYYSPANNEIGLSDLSDKSTLMHEVQHAIQEIEGFAKGSGAKGENYRLSHGEAEARNVQNRLNLGDKFRVKIVKDNNQVGDDYHTWIRDESDIKTFKQAYNDDGGGDLTPDFTEAMAKKAIDSGEITVYSSKPIKAGNFVTPSKMEAKSYAGSGKIYEEKLNLNDISWIDALQGQVTRNKDIHPHETFDVNPNETFVSRENGVNLSHELEKKYILKDGSINEAAVRKEAEPFIEKEYSLENFKAEFPNGKVDTPIGEVSIESRQFNKLKFKGRENFLGLIKPTLERPAFVLDFEDTTFFFKPFRDKDGVIKFASVIKERDGGLDVVSNYPMKNRKFELITREGKVRYVQGSAAKSPIEHSLDNNVRSSGDIKSLEHSSDGKDIIQQNEEKIYHSRKIEEIKQEYPNVEKELDESIASMRKESFNSSNFKDGLISKIGAKEITTKQLGKSVDLSDKQLAVLKNDIKNADFKVISDSKIYFDKMGKDGDKKRFFIDIAEDGKVRVDGYSKKGIDTIPVRQSALEELAGVGDRARLKNMSFEVKAAYFNELDPIKKEAILKTAELNKLKKAAQSGDKVAVAKFEEFKARNLDENGNIKDGLSLC